MIKLIRSLAITLIILGHSLTHAGFLVGSGKDCTITPMQSTNGEVTFVMSSEPIAMKITDSEMWSVLHSVYQGDSTDPYYLTADGGSKNINDTLRLSRSGDIFMLERQTDVGLGGTPLYQQLQFQVAADDFRNLKTISMRSAVGQNGSKNFRPALCKSK